MAGSMSACNGVGSNNPIPTLFVAGTLDGIAPVAQSREIMAGFSNARLPAPAFMPLIAQPAK